MFDKAKIDDRMRRAQHVREIEFYIPQRCIGGLPVRLQLCEFSDSTERAFDELQVAALVNELNAAIAPVKHDEY